METIPDQAEKPNVLLICVDQWAGELMRPNGHPVVMTPTLAQLAHSGVNFSRAYSACPTCIPARRTLMTGQTARTHGDRVFAEHMQMPEGVPTLPQCFRDAGYQAYAVGKLHVYPQRDRIGFDDVILNEEGRHHLGHGVGLAPHEAPHLNPTWDESFEVGDFFMSLIYTAELAGVDPFDYLRTLLLRVSAVASNPAEWMPWNYRDTLASLSSPPDS